MRARAELPVLFTSGYARTNASEHGTLAASAPVLGKPYTTESLATTVRRALDARDRERPAAN